MAVQSDLVVAYTRIFLVELAYWIVSIGMVFVNEFVLSVLTDDLTVFITIFQILFSLGILLTLNHITKMYLNPPSHTNQYVELDDRDSITVNTKLINEDDHDVDERKMELNQEINTTLQQCNGRISQDTRCAKSVASSESLMSLLIVDIPHRINLETCKRVFPLSVLYIGMLLMNNFCLKYVGVASYFVTRSLTTVFNVGFTYFLIDDPVSPGALLCCALIVMGFILGVDQDSVLGSLSVIGVLFGVSSSLFTSLFSIYTKKTLASLDRNIWVLVLYNNINAIVITTPLLIVHGDIQSLISDKITNPTFWLLLSISGVMAFFISIVTNASIKYTSPLTHNISGTAKACLQTVIAVIYYKDDKSHLWWFSNIIILLASGAYSRIKQIEMENKTLKPRPKLPTCSDVTSDLPAKAGSRRDSSSSEASTSYFDSDKINTCLVNVMDSDSVKA